MNSHLFELLNKILIIYKIWFLGNIQTKILYEKGKIKKIKNLGLD